MINSGFLSLRDRFDDVTGKRYPSPLRELFRSEARGPYKKALDFLHNIWLIINPFMAGARMIGLGNLRKRSPEHMEAMFKLWCMVMATTLIRSLAYGNWDEGIFNGFFANLFPGKEEKKRKLKKLYDEAEDNWMQAYLHRMFSMGMGACTPLAVMEIGDGIKSLYGLFEGKSKSAKLIRQWGWDMLNDFETEKFKSGPFKDEAKGKIHLFRNTPGLKGYLKTFRPKTVIKSEQYQIDNE